MIDTDKYMENVDEKYNLIMNLMDDEEREFEIKSRIRERNRIMVAACKLHEENQRLREELKQTRECLWWCYDNYRFDSHPMVDTDWNFIGNLLGAEMESEEE